MNTKGLEKERKNTGCILFEGIQPVSLDDYFCEPVKGVKGGFETILFLAKLLACRIILLPNFLTLFLLYVLDV